jgi:hypothetical protein
MSTINSFLTCPSDCGDLDFGALDTNQDCTSYEQKYSQICGIYFCPSGVDALDWTTPSAPAIPDPATLDNSTTDGSTVKYLVVEAGIDAPEKEVAEYPKRKTRVVGRTYAIRGVVKNMTDNQREFLRQMQCGDTSWTIYYETIGGYIFGGQGGIAISFMDAELPLGGGRDDKELGNILIDFEADGDPPRYTNPYA